MADDTDCTCVLDIAEFRILFPMFADPIIYPDALIEIYFDWATCYISPCCYGYLSGKCRCHALYLMVAHLLWLNANFIIPGQVGGQVIGATISKVSVTLQGAPNPNQWEWWLNQSPYGQALLALLQAAAVGGFYIGGSPERFAFRSEFGYFNRPLFSSGGASGGDCC